MKSALTTVLITLLTLETVQARYDNYKKVGDTVVLSPGSVSAPITSITWKHNSNLAVEWYGGTPDVYPKFKGRCTLNTRTGDLTFPGLTLKDSGSYTPEINNRVLNPTKITVISEVPTPTVSESCDAEKTHCVLTCEGITTDAEPVNCTWWSGDVMKSETKELNITKEEKSSFFRCMMINPVSTKRSNQVVNPVLISNTDNPDKYKKVGDTVVLSPGSVSATITSIVWKHGSTVAVKWDGGESVSYGDFKGRCKLKTTSGELTIPNLTPKDSGRYTAEINGDAIKTTKIKVISAVPTPTISTSCHDKKTYCVFTCEGITTDSGPVSYTWWSGDVMKSKTKELNITKEEKDSSFICKVENPVSSESSKEVNNPFITNNESHNNSQSWIVVVVLILVVVVVVILVLCIRKCKGKKVNNTVKDANNGAVNQENRPDDNVKVEMVSEPLLDENNDAAGQTPTESTESKQPVNTENRDDNIDFEVVSNPSSDENNDAAGQTPTESTESKQPESSNQDQKNTEDNEVTKM